MIPYSRQSISEADIAAVTEVLRSDFLTQGPEVPRFEEAVRARCGAAHAVAVASGTAALHLACRALGLGPGDRLWTSPITFVASANCARYCGADADFVDIEPGTLNLSVAALEEKLHHARREGRLPRIVVPVHFGGLPCDLRAIRALADEYGFRILEDASHALGATYEGAPVGDCRYSDAAVFSFHPVKMITTAEGGMVVTNDAAIAGRVALLRSHGITRDPQQMRSPGDEAWYYEQIDLGEHYRLTDIQAALGRSQMGRLAEFVDARRAIAARYREMLAGLPLRWQAEPEDARSSHHLFVVRIDGDRRSVFARLRNDGIGVNVHYIPVYRQPYYRDLGPLPDCPAAEEYFAGALSLPVFPTMTVDQQNFVVEKLSASLL